MSLKIEQRLDSVFISEHKPRIYATGVYLVPMKVIDGEKERYVWVVDEFNDDSYLNGELCSPIEYTDNLKDLLQSE